MCPFEISQKLSLTRWASKAHNPLASTSPNVNSMQSDTTFVVPEPKLLEEQY